MEELMLYYEGRPIKTISVSSRKKSRLSFVDAELPLTVGMVVEVGAIHGETRQSGVVVRQREFEVILRLD